MDYNTFDFSTTVDGDDSITLAAFIGDFTVADTSGFPVTIS